MISKFSRNIDCNWHTRDLGAGQAIHHGRFGLVLPIGDICGTHNWRTISRGAHQPCSPIRPGPVPYFENLGKFVQLRVEVMMRDKSVALIPQSAKTARFLFRASESRVQWGSALETHPTPNVLVPRVDNPFAVFPIRRQASDVILLNLSKSAR